MNPLARRLVTLCASRGLMVTTAESCTGGLVAAAITEVAGSSAMFGAGYVTYENAAKTAMLGVPSGLIDSVGAVSEAVARGMADGALQRSGADIAVAITGIAGPGGGTPLKPVGTVYFGLATRDATTAAHQRFTGDRASVRRQAVDYALTLLLEAAGDE